MRAEVKAQNVDQQKTSSWHGNLTNVPEVPWLLLEPTAESVYRFNGAFSIRAVSLCTNTSSPAFLKIADAISK
jgi:hypothetical protein